MDVVENFMDEHFSNAEQQIYFYFIGYILNNPSYNSTSITLSHRILSHQDRCGCFSIINCQEAISNVRLCAMIHLMKTKRNVIAGIHETIIRNGGDELEKSFKEKCSEYYLGYCAKTIQRRFRFRKSLNIVAGR